MTFSREIEFENNPSKVCYSGKLLKGKAKLFSSVDIHVRGISIKFFGIGYCQWDEVHTNRTENITGSRTYLDVQQDFVLSLNDGILPAGNKDYTFEIQLPRNLPTSYEGTYGYIRYTVTLCIDSSARRTDPLEEMFTIIKPLNLSNRNAYRMPKEVLKVAQLNRCCLLWWWKSDDIKIYGRLPVSGYCPGQVMNLTLDVFNISGHDILMFLTEFIQEVTYNPANSSIKIETILLDEKKASGCRGNGSGFRSIKINVTVPSVPPTGFLNESHICVLNYKFRVTALTECCHHNPMFDIPVVVGTYPISNEIYSAQAMPESETTAIIASAPITATAPITETTVITEMLNLSDVPPYPDTDPPTYEEATQHSSKFTPKYPVYRRTTSYSSEIA